MTELMPTTLLAFAITFAIIELTPGPNMAYVAALSISHGARVGAAAVAGVALGLAIYGFVAALGLATIIEQSNVLYEILRWGGVAYLLWLAWEAWSSEHETAPEAGDGAGHAIRTVFRRGLMTNLLNPKAGMFYLAVLPSFVTPGTGSVMAQTLLLSGIFVVIASVTHLSIVLLARRHAGGLTDPTRRRAVRKIMAVALAGIAIWFAISTAR